MMDLNKIATDLIIFSMDEFGFFSLPKELCTGSSIMPQKKNPDVLELLRAKYHVVNGYSMQVKGIYSSLVSGYNRDMQLTKEPLLKSVEICIESLKIALVVFEGLIVNKDKCKKAMTSELYATEEALKLVKKGMPFRDAYKKVGEKFS
jgi:argininosuccinate lyase